jgi:hypothetical protein
VPGVNPFSSLNGGSGRSGGAEVGATDETSVYIVLAVVGALALVFIVRYLVSRGGSDGFNRLAFRRAARRYGLRKVQIDYLEHYARQYRARSPEFLLENPAALDKLIKKAIAEIEANEGDESLLEARKSVLFGIRDLAEKHKATGKTIRSTRELPSGLSFSLLTEEGETYPSHIYEVYHNGVSAALPKGNMSDEVRLGKGSKLSCTFYNKAGQGYSFTTKVLGYEARKGSSAMILSHSDSVTLLPNRQYKRKDLNSPCYFYFVRIEDAGKKGGKRAVADSRRVMGTIENISAGGCSLRSANPLRAGDYLKIEFDTGKGETGSAVGKVLRVNKSKRYGGVMHIKFARSSRKTLNDIRSFVYGYEE